MATESKQPRICCYVKCKDNKPLDGRIEVKTVLPSQGLEKLKPLFLVNWRWNGEAEFHKTCWENVSDLSKFRLSKSTKDGSRMSKEEKALVKAASEALEEFDNVKDILDKAKIAAEWIKQAKHCVAFTGAGISTSAGIGDYRGKAGKWTEEDQTGLNMDRVFGETSHSQSGQIITKSNNQGQSSQGMGEPNNQGQSSQEMGEPVKQEVDVSEEEIEDNDEDGVPYEKLRPTYTHEAIYKLMESNYLKYVISQNGDGLHGLSGIKPDKISELHGNVFREYCEKCTESYERKFYVMDDVGSQYFEEREDYGYSSVKKPRHAKKCDLCGLSHRTGRKCEKKGCNGFLLDTIINFRDMLDEDILDLATEHSEQCDVMLCLGTTLQVTPACDLVRKMKNKNQIIICNRQETPMDHHFMKKTKSGTTRGCRVFGDCDLFMREMMKHIYPEKELKDWESERDTRLKQYDMNRE